MFNHFKTHFSSFWEALRASYFFVPATMALGAVILAELLVWADNQLEGDLPDWIYAGGPEAAWTLLSAIVGAMMSVTSVVFSITIVALTLAANQFGPRLPRNFMRDRGAQLTLGTFIATFVYALLLLRAIKEHEVFVPQLSISVAIILTLISTGVLIFFIHHIAYSIQAESVIGVVDNELAQSIRRLYPEDSAEDQAADDEQQQSLPQDFPEDFDERCAGVPAKHSSYLQAVDADSVLHLAVKHDVLIRFLKRPGDFLSEGENLVLVYPEDRCDAKLGHKIRQATVTGVRRTPTQDVEYGILQFVEIAVRALSPGINDPFTAIACIDRLGSNLRRVAARPEPDHTCRDQHGKLRVLLESTDFFGHMDVAFNQIRQNARDSVAVLVRLLETLQKIAVVIEEPRRLDSIRCHAEMVLECARRHVEEPRDLHEVEDRFEGVMEEIEKKKP